MTETQQPAPESADAIKRRMAKQRRRARAAARAKARSTHIAFVLVIIVGMALVVPRYPGILIFMLPPFAVLAAFAIGAGLWRLSPIKRWYARQFGRPPSFWHSLITGAALLGVALWIAIAVSTSSPAGAW